MIRATQFLTLLTWKCDPRHNSAHFFDISTSKGAPSLVCFVHFDLEMCFVPQRRVYIISHLASWLRTRPFSEPTFRPSWARNHWKNKVNRDFPTFSSHLHLLSSLCSSSLIFSLLFFSSLTLRTSAFPSVHIVGSLTSKLPLTRNKYGWAIIISSRQISSSWVAYAYTINMYIYIYINKYTYENMSCIHICK